MSITTSARNLLALLLAAGTCQASISAALLLTSSAAIGSFAPPASAQVAAGVIVTGIIGAAASVGNFIHGITGDDNAKREAFTQQYISNINQQYPNYNAVISHNGGTVEGNNVVHQHVELGMAVGTCGYEVYLSPKGQHFKFVRNGDGGFINWAYGGDFNRDGSTITAN